MRYIFEFLYITYEELNVKNKQTKKVNKPQMSVISFKRAKTF